MLGLFVNSVWWIDNFERSEPNFCYYSRAVGIIAYEVYKRVFVALSFKELASLAIDYTFLFKMRGSLRLQKNLIHLFVV